MQPMKGQGTKKKKVQGEKLKSNKDRENLHSAITIKVNIKQLSFDIV